MKSCTIWKTIFLLAINLFVVKADKCLPGEFHKNTSSPAMKNYPVCQAWSNDTCCTANFTNELSKNQVKNVYNLHWGHCKNLSKECEKYILAEECFFSCEPKLIKWHTGEKYYIHNVPVCGDYCDEWYEACKNDETCVENWNHLNYSSSAQDCPKGSKCQSFEQIYGNGKNLCNKMWGKTFVYTDLKRCPCTRLDEPIPVGIDNMSTCSGNEHAAKLLLYLVIAPLGLALKAFFY